MHQVTRYSIWGTQDGKKTKNKKWPKEAAYPNVTGHSKKKCQQNCSSVFCWSLLLFYSDKVHKQWLKVWFLTSQMPVLSGGMNFVPFEITSKKFFSKIPMKCSKNGQKFAMSKNTSNMLFETCWTPCKKPHFSTWSRSWYTFFWITPYLDNCKCYLESENTVWSRAFVTFREGISAQWKQL